MKTSFLPLLLLGLLCRPAIAQNYSPIVTSGYNLDAVAENTTALATTGGALDGSDYVLYSEAYGTIFSIVGGLPNSGVITSPGYSFQLQPYSQNNVLFALIGQTHTISVNTPSAYASISLLGFATEGTGNMNVTLGFTDNSTQTFSNLLVNDWFAAAGAVISGFGRAGRTSGTIVNPAGQPKLFNINLLLSCANRSKNLAYIAVNNASGNARLCMMAVAGSGAPSYTANSTPVSCIGGTNGTASVQVSNSLPPNTYTWSSTPVQSGALASNLVAGLYNYTVADGAGCTFSSSVSVGVSTVPLSPLLIGTSSTLVCPGTPVTLSTFGAVSYTWSNGLNSPVTTVSPQTASSYSVIGTTAANCAVSGSVNISTHSVQQVTFTPLPASFCVNSGSIALSAVPGGGTFSGSGVNGSAFFPGNSGAGTFTLHYQFSDANNCVSSGTGTTTVHALPLLGFTLIPSVFCLNSPTLTLVASPSGGSFSGNGVNASVFSPSLHAAGSSSITYVYTDANNCTASALVGVTVNPIPAVSFTAPVSTICIRAASIPLQAGPSGGQFSGAGISGSVFTPSVAGLGTHTLTYSYTDITNACSNSQSHAITVSACTGWLEESDSDATTLKIYPNPSASFITIQGAMDGSLFLLNALGQVVASYSLNTGNAHTISVDGLAEGLYSIVFSSLSGTKVYKVLVRQ